jgi:hypothetical protein
MVIDASRTAPIWGGSCFGGAVTPNPIGISGGFFVAHTHICVWRRPGNLRICRGDLHVFSCSFAGHRVVVLQGPAILVNFMRPSYY